MLRDKNRPEIVVMRENYLFVFYSILDTLRRRVFPAQKIQGPMKYQ